MGLMEHTHTKNEKWLCDIYGVCVCARPTDLLSHAALYNNHHHHKKKA